MFRGIGEESVIYLLNNRDYPSVMEEITSDGTVNVICCGVRNGFFFVHARDQQCITSLLYKYCVCNIVTRKMYSIKIVQQFFRLGNRVY